MAQDTVEAPQERPKRKRPALFTTLGRKAPTDVPWQQIRDAVEAGLTILQAAKRWNVSYEAAKKRAQREGWKVISTLMAEARQRLSLSGQSVPKLVPMALESAGIGLEEAKKARVELGTVLLENAQQIAESGSMLGLQILHGQLEDAKRNEGGLMPLVDAKGIVTAIRGVRMAAGLDKQQVNVGLNLWSDSQMSRDVPGTVHDVPEVEVWADEA